MISKINPKVAEIREFIAGLYQAGVVIGADGVTCSIHPVGVSRERGRFIADLCQREGARASLEIGMAWGLSTLFILEALVANDAPPGAHVVVDPFQTADFHGAALASIRRLGLEPMIEFHEEFSELALPKMVQEQRLFDFIFIDGNHRFDGVFIDAVFADRMLKPGGVMLFDDTWCNPVFLTCRYLETNYGYLPIAEYPMRRANRTSRRLYRGHLRAYRKPLHKSAPALFYFEPFFAGINPGDGEERRLRTEGLRALHAGDPQVARRAFIAARRLNPRRLNTWLRLLRTYLPATFSRQEH
jgi:predicted O-methyltransferase YrrM